MVETNIENYVKTETTENVKSNTSIKNRKQHGALTIVCVVSILLSLLVLSYVYLKETSDIFDDKVEEVVATCTKVQEKEVIESDGSTTVYYIPFFEYQVYDSHYGSWLYNDKYTDSKDFIVGNQYIISLDNESMPKSLLERK